MYSDIRQFVNALEAAGELKRVRAKVDPVLEIAAIADRVSKMRAPRLPAQRTQATDPRFCGLGGPAVLFENVEGSDIPVLINAFGSYRRMEMALGLDEHGHTAGGFEALAAKIAELTKPEPPKGLADLLAKVKQFAPLLRIPPKRMRGSGACQEVVLRGDAIDLTRLPLIKCWPHDGDFAALGYPADVNDGIEGLGRGAEWDARHRGRYITLGGIHTIHADDEGNAKPSSHNIGMYRVQLLGKQRMAMHWHMHHDGARHWRSWKKLGKPMPVAIALGGESVLPYAATAPLPPGLSELLLAGFLNRRGIEMVRGKTVPIWVPANAEIVIEGFVSEQAGFIGWEPDGSEPDRLEPGENSNHKVHNSNPGIGAGAVFEGPFGDHTGFYSLPDRYPLLTVTAITMRREPVYPTTVVGLPPQEDYFLGKATERIFLPLLRTLLPDIEDYDLPMFGAFHNCAVLKIKKSYPLHGRRVMHGVWGAGQMAWTKTIFVVDQHVNPHDTSAVFAEASKHCDPGRDIEQVWGPLDILDHAAPRLGAGMKVGFDCTMKIAGEEVGGGAWAGAGSLSSSRGAVADREQLARNVRSLPDVLATSFAFGDTGWLLVQLDKSRGGQSADFIDVLGEEATKRGWTLPPFVVVLGPEAPGFADGSASDGALFHWMAHSDASRDWRRLRIGQDQTLVIDATPKMAGDEAHGQPVRKWPPVLRVSEEIRARVEGRWGEYGVGQ